MKEENEGFKKLMEIKYNLHFTPNNIEIEDGFVLINTQEDRMLIYQVVLSDIIKLLTSTKESEGESTFYHELLLNYYSIQELYLYNKKLLLRKYGIHPEASLETVRQEEILFLDKVLTKYKQLKDKVLELGETAFDWKKEFLNLDFSQGIDIEKVDFNFLLFKIHLIEQKINELIRENNSPNIEQQDITNLSNEIKEEGKKEDKGDVIL